MGLGVKFAKGIFVILCLITVGLALWQFILSIKHVSAGSRSSSDIYTILAVSLLLIGLLFVIM